MADAGEAVLTGRAARGRSGAVVEVADLVKVYQGGTRAVDGISFSVGAGEFFGFLGPNGAGKTTTIKVLATLTRPTSGSARVAGLDVTGSPGAVRARIGLAMQVAALENLLTGRENLELSGRLHDVPERELRPRIDELLELMNLTAAAGRLAGTYSGGMRRRLDLATALVHRPEVLFLDEPTEGLDPQSRSALWDELVRINRAGTTMFLTTHYMEEADRLCDRLAIVDEGRIILDGVPAELKRGVGADRALVSLAAESRARAAELVAGGTAWLSDAGVEAVEPTDAGLSITVANAHTAIPAIVRGLEAGGLVIEGLATYEPTLDDVFLKACGRHIRAEAADRPLELSWM